jgi:uncharacterized protein (DUF1778 family)
MTAVKEQARVDFRTTAEIKALMEQAAGIAGMTLSEYVKSAAVAQAHQTIVRHETRRLSDRDRDTFLSLLDAPAEPNEALRLAAADFKRAVDTGDVIP